MTADREYYVFTREGDGTAEVDALVDGIGSAEVAGLHRHFFVTRANQTVVMTVDAGVPLAHALRQRSAWREPEGQDSGFGIRDSGGSA